MRFVRFHLWWLPDRAPAWRDLPPGARVFAAAGLLGATAAFAAVAALGVTAGVALCGTVLVVGLLAGAFLAL